ncbi:MAG: type III pantothenate kinase [Lysobacter sp.]
MSAWLFDLGNTRLKCAPVGEDGMPGEIIALDHRDRDLAPQLAHVLPARFDAAYVASVASEPLRVALLDALITHCRRICVARTQRAFDGIRIAYAQPHKLGIDRFLALLAAHGRGEGAALVCAVGTALTVDLIDDEGRHRGGRIAPSPTLMREALHARAAQLPTVGGDYQPFAADTADALASGCEGAALALIERSLDAARDELGATPQLLLHGGGSDALWPHLANATLVPALVLQGLARWARADAPA